MPQLNCCKIFSDHLIPLLYPRHYEILIWNLHRRMKVELRNIVVVRKLTVSCLGRRMVYITFSEIHGPRSGMLLNSTWLDSSSKVVLRWAQLTAFCRPAWHLPRFDTAR